MKQGKVFVALAILSVLALMLVPAVSLDSAVADGKDVGIHPDADSLTINAGQSGSFYLVITNNLDKDADSLTNDRMISVRLETGTEATTSLKMDSDRDSKVLEGQDHWSGKVTLNIDKYAATGQYTLKIILEVRTLTSDISEPETFEKNVTFHIDSALSAGDSFNRILGIFDNPLPAPFNDPAFTSIVSFFLWMLLGLVAFMVVMPLIVRLFMRNHKKEGESLVSGTRKLILPIVFLYAISKSLRVYGAPESIISTFEVWFGIMYIILGSVIIWKVYLVFIHYSVNKLDENLEDLNGSTSGSLEPLFRLLGKLILSVFAVAMILGALGFSLASIVTSAGIVSLGITLGAQSVLNQFFSGLVLLMTRPFKANDIVRLGNSPGTYRVVKVDIMNTVFRNWENEETIIMPNNTVASSSIINLTGKNTMYKIHVHMTVAYGSNIEKARSIMLDIAMRHPRIVKDGSVDMPYTRVTALGSSDIQVRLTAYVDDFNDNGMIEGELRVAIYHAFNENGISIPFPQLDVHVDHKDKS